MANKQHAQFSDENGNLFYLENQTEDVLDPSGKPLSDGGDLSEASVKFSVDTSRKLPQSGGRFKAFLGSIVKYLTDLGAAAYLAVANNDTTTQPGFVGDARVLKQHRDAINQLNSELNDYKISNYESVNVSNKALNIAYSDRFININFLGLSLSEPLSANSGRNIVSNFDAYTTPNLNYITIPLVALNANNVPIGTATALVFDGTITVVTNIDLGTTDKLYGSNTKWYSEY